MDKSTEIHHSESQSQNINRRELLKILAAAGSGLAAAAFVPAKWMKPVVEAGVLPAHAHATDQLVLNNLVVNQIQGLSKSQSTRPPHWNGSVQYHDDLCKVGVESTQLVGSCPSLVDWSVSPPGDSCDGTFYFDFWANCNEVLSVYLNVGARQSNSLSHDLNCYSY